LGGVQVHLDHRVIDGSVQRQLAELREQLTSVRVF
jgi:F0F1-type ATP synthase delta subunit